VISDPSPKDVCWFVALWTLCEYAITKVIDAIDPLPDEHSDVGNRYIVKINIQSATIADGRMIKIVTENKATQGQEFTLISCKIMGRAIILVLEEGDELGLIAIRTIFNH